MNKTRGFEIVKKDEVQMLPLRATKTSAGYDFYAVEELTIKPQSKVFFWTNVKAYMNQGEVLLLDVRSSIGVKQDLMLANTIGVVDADYVNNIETLGNIGICLRNLKPAMELENVAYTRLPMYTTQQIELEDGSIDHVLLTDYDEKEKATLVEMDFPIPIIKDLTVSNTVVIKSGERVAQGIFLNYLPSDNCNSDKERTGGFGSTSK